MKKIKLNEVRERTMSIDSIIIKNIKGGGPNSFSGNCAKAYYAACGSSTCNTGEIIANLVEAGTC